MLAASDPQQARAFAAQTEELRSRGIDLADYERLAPA